MKFKIINGLVYDPTQKINGVKKDIFIDDNKIVNPSKSELEKFKITYDVSIHYATSLINLDVIMLLL